MVCGIMPRALLHGRGAGARSRSPLARQGAGSRVLEVALERVLRALVAFLPAAAASAAAGYGVPVVQRSQFLYALIFFVRPDSSISDDRRQPGPQPPPWMVGSCLGVLSLVPATGAESRPDLRFPGSRVLDRQYWFGP